MVDIFVKIQRKIMSEYLAIVSFELMEYCGSIVNMGTLGIYTNSAFGEINVISRALSCLRRVLTAVKPAKPAPIIARSVEEPDSGHFCKNTEENNE
jgi:hypothetical protein